MVKLVRQQVIAGGGSLNDFFGEADTETTTVSLLKCQYQRTISADQRTKMGLNDSITAIVTIPALEAKRVFGVPNLPSVNGLTARLFGDEYDVIKVVAWEPFEINGQQLCLGWTLHLTKLEDSKAEESNLVLPMPYVPEPEAPNTTTVYLT